MAEKGSIHRRIYGEKEQGLQARQTLLQEIGDACGGKAAVSYYMSFNQESVMITDHDIAPLEDILQCSDLSKGLLLLISSPGGSGLAAERIINICRQYSNDNFHTLVPKQAKSAATMICLGAESIYMSQTSELGPIDPQVPQIIHGNLRFIPADLIVDSYKDLLQKAVRSKGRIEPFLQQLQAYDSRLIAQYEREQKLGKDIAVKALKQGMLKALTELDIETKIEPFTKAGLTGSHGRPILSKQAEDCGLKIEKIDIESELWGKVLEFHLRSDSLVSGERFAKVIESPDHQFLAPLVRTN